MIGVFDSGHGGLTVFRALQARFPDMAFAYLGDHANAPYGDRRSSEVIDLTRTGIETLFGLGARLIVLGCNTATCVAARTLQRDWLPTSPWTGRNILGIVAPTVEAATQTPWAISSPQYPQKYNTDLIAVFGTTRTVTSGVYREEILKRCPKAIVIEQACPALAGAIEAGTGEAELERMVQIGVNAMLEKAANAPPHRAILGCTHYPLVEHLFRRHLPAFTRLLPQPEVVADSLEDYLTRHPYYATPAQWAAPLLLTTGNAATVSAGARVFWPDAPDFRTIASA
jgi:glutamate racemase